MAHGAHRIPAPHRGFRRSACQVQHVRSGPEALQQLHGLFQVTQRLGRRADALRVGGRVHRGGERAGQIQRDQPVVRQLGGDDLIPRPEWKVARPGEPRTGGGVGGGSGGVGAGSREHGGEASVQADPLRRQQFPVHHLLQERVPEPEARADRHQQADLQRLAQPRFELVGRQLRGGDQQVRRGRPARNGRHPQCLPPRCAQRLDPRQQQVGQVVGQIVGHVLPQVQHPRAELASAAPGQLLGEEGVALAAPEDRLDHRRPDPLPGQPVQQLADLVPDQRGQGQSGDLGQPGQVGQQRAQRVSPMQIVGPVAAENGDPSRAQRPGQECQQSPGARVGPVQVLQNQQHRAGLAEPGQQPVHRLEQLTLRQALTPRTGPRDRPVGGSQVTAVPRRRTLVAQMGYQPGQRGATGRLDPQQLQSPGRLLHRAQRIHHRQVGHPEVTDLDAGSDQHRGRQVVTPRTAGRGDDFLQQAGLAHSGVPAEHHQSRAPLDGLPPDPGELAELDGTTDQRPGGGTTHSVIVAHPTDTAQVRGRTSAHAVRTTPVGPATRADGRSGPASGRRIGARMRVRRVWRARNRSRRPAAAAASRCSCRMCSVTNRSVAYQLVVMPMTIRLRPPGTHRHLSLRRPQIERSAAGPASWVAGQQERVRVLAKLRSAPVNGSSKLMVAASSCSGAE